MMSVNIDDLKQVIINLSKTLIDLTSYSDAEEVFHGVLIDTITEGNKQ